MDEKYESDSALNSASAPDSKRYTFPVSEMLSPLEIESLRQDKKRLIDHMPQAFAHLKKQ